MPWQVLYSADEVPRPDRRDAPVGPSASLKDKAKGAAPLVSPVRIQPPSLTIGRDGRVRPSLEDDEDGD